MHLHGGSSLTEEACLPKQCLNCGCVFEFPTVIMNMDGQVVSEEPARAWDFRDEEWIYLDGMLKQVVLVPWTCTECYVKEYYEFIRIIERSDEDE